MHAITLSRLEYRLLPTPFARADANALDAMRRQAECVGEAAADFAAQAGGTFDHYCMGSTLSSHHLSDPDSSRDLYKRLIADRAGRWPSPAVNVYECTNWAFLLRDGLEKSRAHGRQQRLLVQVVDCDVHGIEAAWKTRTYGHARFGILSMDIRINHRGRFGDIVIGSAPAAVSMMKFGSRLRAAARENGGAVVSPPFFPEPARGAFRKMISGMPSLPDHHDRFGHCFGSDPWIGIGLAHPALNSERPQAYLVASLALNGYHAIATVTVEGNAVCRVEMPQ